MRYVPHAYQTEAYNRLIKHDRYNVFLKMGLGKTVVTLTAIDDLMHDYFEVKRVLVIAPLRVAEDTWSTESKKWDHLKHLKLSLVLGPLNQRIKALNTKADIYIINRENVEWLVDHYKTDWPFDMVVVDELSSFKNPSSHRFKALRKMMPLTNRFIGLTGTPAPNSLIDLWSQIYLVDKGERLGKTVKMYRETYFSPGWGNGHIVYKWNLREGSEEKIFDKISDICMSMKAEDWIKVPERLDSIKTITFPPALMKQYKAFERDTIMELANNETIVASTAAVVTNKLLQFANGAIYDDDRKVHKVHDMKLEALADLIESANGDPVIVFYSYQHDLARIKAYFPELDIRTIEGPKDIKDWNDRKIQVMCLHPASAGHGLNLQAGGNIIIWFGLNYSLELYQQANARLHRQGQTEKVLVHHIVAKGTMDEAVMEALARKDISQARLIDAVKARIVNGQ